MAIVAASRDTLTETVDIVRLISTDSLAVVQAAGYLTSQIANLEALNNGIWNWHTSDEVLINYGAIQDSNGNYIDGTNKFYQVTPDFTSLMSSSLIQTFSTTLTAAQVNVAYTTPQLLAAAPGAGLILVPTYATMVTNFAVAFTGGGAATVQWGTTAAGAGTNSLSATIPAAEITAAASQIYSLPGHTAAALTGITNEGLYFSNATQVFAGGAGSSLSFNISCLLVAGTV